jgi:hypothetical protein
MFNRIMYFSCRLVSFSCWQQCALSSPLAVTAVEVQEIMAVDQEALEEE